MSKRTNETQGEPLFVLRDRDIFTSAGDAPDVEWKDRPTGKVVLVNESNEVALIGNKVNNHFSLPGGGIEEDDETVLAGTIRECKEETGCDIEVIEELGYTEDFRIRDNRHCTSFGFFAKIVAYGEPKLTDNEVDVGAYVTWVSFPEAIELLAQQEEQVKRGEVKFYNTCFNTVRDLLFLRLANKLVDK